MERWVLAVAMKWKVLLIAGILPAIACAQEIADWRLELLKERGLSAETEALETFQKGLGNPGEDLGRKVQQLSSDEFKQREQAQKDILLMGKNVLPQLRPMLDSDDPEVRTRLITIVGQLEGGGRWSKEELLREAVISLLEERKHPDAARPKGKIFVEFFNKDAVSVSDGYQRFKYESDIEVGGSVQNGMACLKGSHDSDGDQQLLLLAKDLTGKDEFPDSFSVESRIGSSQERAGTGAYHVGISIGNIRALFHPGYNTGAFRIEQVSDNTSILANTDMGFTPPLGKLLLMSMDITRLPNKDVKISVRLTHEKQTFRMSQIVKADVIGKLDRIGLDRSGRGGADAHFDDLVLDLD